MAKTTTDKWYEIQYSRIGENDWFKEGCTFEDLESAKDYLKKGSFSEEIKLRIVFKTTTEEVIYLADTPKD